MNRTQPRRRPGADALAAFSSCSGVEADTTARTSPVVSIAKLGLQLRNNTPVSGQGQSARQPFAGHAIDRGLGDGLRPRSVGDRSQAPGAHDCRYLIPFLGSRWSRGVVSTEVVEVLERVCNEVGFPATIRVDQGSELGSHDLDLFGQPPRRHAGLLRASCRTASRRCRVGCNVSCSMRRIKLGLPANRSSQPLVRRADGVSLPESAD